VGRRRSPGGRPVAADADAERHPELAFRSTAVREDSDELVVEGELTIRGITLPVEARGDLTEPVMDPYGAERLA
jgi:polyisoprenoid-binding protein YceI